MWATSRYAKVFNLGGGGTSAELFRPEYDDIVGNTFRRWVFRSATTVQQSARPAWAMAILEQPVI